MLKLFRAASFIEGMSYLVILCVTIGLISRDFVSVLGMTHGMLFMIYCALALVVSHRQGWSPKVSLLLLASALVPFAFVPVELFLQRELRKVVGEA